MYGWKYHPESDIESTKAAHLDQASKEQNDSEVMLIIVVQVSRPKARASQKESHIQD